MEISAYYKEPPLKGAINLVEYVKPHHTIFELVIIADQGGLLCRKTFPSIKNAVAHATKYHCLPHLWKINQG